MQRMLAARLRLKGFGSGAANEAAPEVLMLKLLCRAQWAPPIMLRTRSIYLLLLVQQLAE